MNADGTGVERVRDALWGEMPAWSPDGTRLAYRDRLTNCLVVLSLSQPATRTELSCDLSARYPTWSPDGARIAFGVGSAGPLNGIYVVNADGTGRTNLGYAGISTPAWSPR